MQIARIHTTSQPEAPFPRSPRPADDCRLANTAQADLTPQIGMIIISQQ
jgi:hypothetical protein